MHGTRRLVGGLMAVCILALSAPGAGWASPADGVMPDLRGSPPWALLLGWEGTELQDGTTAHRLVVNKQLQDADYSISLAQNRIAGKLDATYLVAMRDIYAPLEMATEYEERLDEAVGSLALALGLDPRQTQQVRKLVYDAVESEGQRSFHVVVGKLIFHCASYLPTSVTQGWTLTVLSMASENAIAKGIVAQLRAQNSKKDKIRINQASQLRLAHRWSALYALGKAWTKELPQSASAWRTLGEAALESRKYPEAVKAMQTALGLSRGDTAAWKTLAFAQAGARDWKGSGASFQKALDRNPRDVEALWNLGVALAYQARYNALPGVQLRLRAIDPALGQRFHDQLIRQIPAQQAENR